MTAMDWAAKIVEENGRDLAESFLSAARNGDWRAAQALMDRIYGKPEAAIVARVPPNPAHDVIRSMSLDELALLRRLRAGEPVATTPTLPSKRFHRLGSRPNPANAVDRSESQVLGRGSPLD
jgi:hypothetical protein